MLNWTGNNFFFFFKAVRKSWSDGNFKEHLIRNEVEEILALGQKS